ncbi:MAG TPA: hypothetical protein DIU15_09630 [Deltaproteobacteria bacterium]|nr:hypothetical protein [Deltaproteobacteria bacterium]HCP46291.1 hypothetical protein [Deltaproteobacteria bacterium]
MTTPRSWALWGIRSMVVLLVIAIALAFLPSRQEAACETAEWEAKKGWISAHTRLASLHDRLVQAELYQQANHFDGPLDGSRWELWRIARETAEQAEASAHMSPLRARLTAQAAAESCWAARDNTEPIPVTHLAGDTVADSSDKRRRYRPGSTAVSACEQAFARSEEAWEVCSFRMAEGAILEANLARSDYDFFGSGCR